MSKNSKIDFNHRVIWTNTDYDEWEKSMREDYPDEEEDLSYESYQDDCAIWLDDERCNLNIEVEGYIVGYASLGLWNGGYNAAAIIGTNVKDILSSECDYLDWYADRYNVRCKAIHHDGTNYYLYRVAKTREEAERLVKAIFYHGMTEEQFRKRTKSLRPYVAEVYGW